MEDESYGTYRWVSEFLISNFSPFSALLIALIPIVWTWFTITMFILLMNMFDLGQHRINGRIHIGGHAFCENQQDTPCFCSQGRTDSSCQAGPVSQNQIR